jgi:hypothetical protein
MIDNEQQLPNVVHVSLTKPKKLGRALRRRTATASHTAPERSESW